MSEGSVEIEQLMVPVVEGADDMTGITPEAMSEFEDRMESMGVEKDTPAWRRVRKHPEGRVRPQCGTRSLQ